MKNLFIIDQYEKKRILELHNGFKNNFLLKEGADYGLGAITVESNGTLKLNEFLSMEDASGKYGADELGLDPGVVFVKNNNTLVAQNVPYKLIADFTGRERASGNGNIIYYCETQRFVIEGDQYKRQFWAENFQASTRKGFTDLCSNILPKPNENETQTAVAQGETTTSTASTASTASTESDYGTYQGEDKKYTVNPSVTAFQNALTMIGYSTGKVDGKFGPKTKAGLESFQNDYGLTSSLGKMDKTTALKMIEVLKDEKPNESAEVQQELSKITGTVTTQ